MQALLPSSLPTCAHTAWEERGQDGEGSVLDPSSQDKGASTPWTPLAERRPPLSRGAKLAPSVSLYNLVPKALPRVGAGLAAIWARLVAENLALHQGLGLCTGPSQGWLNCVFTVQ